MITLTIEKNKNIQDQFFLLLLLKQLFEIELTCLDYCLNREWIMFGNGVVMPTVLEEFELMHDVIRFY